jgi:tetratricopeptide (TPR) repeat protein
MLQSDLYQRGPQSPREVPVLRPLPPPLDGPPLWTDPAGWDPVVFDLLSTVAAFHARDFTPEEREGVAGALDAARRAVEISPDYALEVFELGLYEYLSGDTQQAVAHLREAERLDCAPNRGNDITNDIVRQVAAEHPQAVLVDADALFMQRAPEGLVGYEFIMDNCHLHPGARHVLMADFVPAIERLLPP